MRYKVKSLLGSVILSLLLLFGLSSSMVTQGEENKFVNQLKEFVFQTNHSLEGDFFGTLAITSPVNLGVVDFSLELEQLSENYAGSVTVSRTTHFSNTPEINAFITGSINGITPTFAIQSIPIVENVSGQLVTRTFSIEGEVINSGHTLDGIYSETIIGYSNKPLNINGIVRLSRPQAALANGIAAPDLLLSTEKSFVSINQSMDIDVTVTDGDGGFIANETVSFVTDLGSISPNPITTDSSGKATVAFAAGSSLGTATIEAQTGQGLTKQLQLEVVPDILIQVTADQTKLPTGGGQSIVTVQVTDNNSTPQANAEIMIEAQLGTLDQSTLTTDAQGKATVLFTSGLTPGFGIVKATYLGVSNQVAVPIEIRKAADLQLVAANLSLNIGGSTDLSVELKDQFGQPMSGELVTFFGTQGTVSPDNALTDADGKASSAFTAGNSFGSANIQAMVGSVSDSVIIQIADPTALFVSAVNPDNGISTGGTLITISGANFANGAQVTVGGNSCLNVVFVSSSELQCMTPAGTEGAVDIRVINPDNDAYTLSSAFTYTPEGPGGVGDDFIYLPIIISE